jgi:hypothetical protein
MCSPPQGGGGTALPELLHGLLADALRLLKPLVPDPSHALAPLLFSSLHRIVAAFLDCLHHLAFELPLQSNGLGCQ